MIVLYSLLQDCLKPTETLSSKLNTSTSMRRTVNLPLYTGGGISFFAKTCVFELKFHGYDLKLGQKTTYIYTLHLSSISHMKVKQFGWLSDDF